MTSDKHSEEFRRYVELFRAAFDELHDAVVRHVKTFGQYVRAHSDYPVMSVLSSGFPSFHEVGSYQDTAPRNYVGAVRPRGLDALVITLSGRPRPEVNLPKGAELAAFLRDHDIGKRFEFGRFDYRPVSADWLVDHLVEDAVERYLHLYGLAAPVDAKRRDYVIGPLIFGTVRRSLDLRLVVPIVMTHFEVDHFPLTDTSYLTRLPKKMQLARARISTIGTGAAEGVVGAATHAFVSNAWHLEVDNIHEVRESLARSSANNVDAIDSFFGALRVATGISTGYAQILWMPRKWTLDYFCDLPPLYGTAMRRYPAEYDHYGWTRQGETVTKDQLGEVRRIYRAVSASDSEAVRLALRVRLKINTH